MIRTLPLCVPLLAVLLASGLSERRAKARALIAPLAGIFQFVFALLAVFLPGFPPAVFPGGVDKVFFLLVSAVFLAASILPSGNFTSPSAGGDALARRGALTGMTLFLLAATAVCLADSLFQTWVALAGSAFSLAAGLGAFDGAKAAARKCCILTALGLAAAGAGVFLLSRSEARSGFLLTAVGFAPVMSLLPQAVWTPAVFSSGPASLGALSAGALAPLGFLSLWRAFAAAGEGAYAASLLVGLGGIAVAAAGAAMALSRGNAAFLAGACSFHMGLAVFGLGFGPPGRWNSLYHVFAAAPVLASLAMLSGNEILFGRSGAGQSPRWRPFTVLIWLCGVFACFCLPPFGTFPSLAAMLGDVFSGGGRASGAGILAVLAAGFFRRLAVVQTPAFRTTPFSEPDGEGGAEEAFRMILPPLLLLLASALLGVSVPDWVDGALSIVGTR